MDPEIWGPKLWFVIHTIALNFPDNPTYEDIRNTEHFFNSLKFNIPCDKCKIHYTQRINKNPIMNHLKNSDTLFRYTIELHNDVNVSLGKRTYTYDEVVAIYKKAFKQEETKLNRFQHIFNWKTYSIIGILLIMIMSILYYKKMYKYRIIKSK
jgi:hypothetical protein